MRSRKALNELNSSLSQIKKNLKMLKPPGYNMDVKEMIILANKKISPIIEMLVETPNSTEHFISIKECSDIEEASNIIIDVATALDSIGFQTNIKLVNLDMKKYRESANQQGYIYVDTVLLLEILEIYNNLESIKYDIDAFYKSIGIHSFVQTGSDLISLSSTDSANSNKIVFKLKKCLQEDNSSTALFKNNIIVMSSASEIVPLNESKSQMLEGNVSNIKDDSLRRTKSASSIENEEIHQVTDVYGARKVLVKCIWDLQGVSNYLGIPRKDVSTICSRVEVDNLPRDSYRKKSSVSDKPIRVVNNNDQHQDNEIDDLNRCCCSECFAQVQGSDANLKECEDDQVIICIKGCNEEEGDVQIVIRQCPDCKKAADNRTIEKPPPEIKNDQKSQSSPKILPKKEVQPRIVNTSSDITESSIDPRVVERSYNSYPDNNIKEIESTILHNKDSKGSLICSDEEDEEKQKESAQVEPTYTQNRVSCSRIKLFETTNLCLQTDSGKELVISLTVTPKDLSVGPKRLSITDIFSDSDYMQRENVSESKPKYLKKPSYSSKQSDYFGNEPNQSDRGSAQVSERKSVSKRTRESYFVADRYIPLERTKVCSSLDFDVTTVDSKIRNKGIQNKNNNIVVQLQKFGTDNLLRACRPAKCCRKAVLNEKMKKCLPYAPSLRSLPLDDDDMNVINQSLQMSLQKVKNSTNINRDFYMNQVNYYSHPVRTVMYFFLEQDLSKNDLRAICRKTLLNQKLSYYINLVNDTQWDINSKYDILYFGVDSKLDKNQNNESVKVYSGEGESDRNNKIDDVESVEVMSNRLRWMAQKYNNYDDRPAISNKRDLMMKHDSFITKNMKNNSHKSAKLSSQLERSITQKKLYVSRIPVYSGHKSTTLNSDKINHPNTEAELCEISLSSLPQKYEVTKEYLIASSLQSNPPIKEINIQNKNMKHNVMIQSFEEYNNFLTSKSSSKYSMTSTVRRSKRKKKEFYLSRSKSDISLFTLKHMVKNKIMTPAPKSLVKEKASIGTTPKEVSRTISQLSNTFNDQDSSKIILQYFSKLLYEMIIKEMSKEQRNTELNKNIKRQISVSVGTEYSSFQELYKKPPKLGTVRNVGNLDIKLSYNTLKAKQSQYCIVEENQGNSNHFCIYHNLALQTSKIFGDNKKCQTSNTLLAYILNSNNRIENSSFKKKRIFKKTYNLEDINGMRNSCNEIENFIVTFKSDETLGSNFSEGGFISSNSYSSRQLTDSDQEDSLSQSLIKLKETLEKYENVKSKIANKSLRESNIDPIEYFVYQVCACNKFNKKPSVMQKILSKTKGLFSAVEKDICRKYKNQREFFSMSQSEKDLCHRCGCYISKCGTTPPANIQTTSPILCKCPQEHKANNKDLKSKPKCNLSKIASASSSSLNSIKASIKKSVRDILRPKKGNDLRPCSCGKKSIEKKNIDTVCVPENVSVVICEKKSISTGTTKDSSTQKCECKKCNNFSDDGTCCCSHCLGCLDKTFDAKPDNNSVGIATDEKSVPSDDMEKRSVSSEKINKNDSVPPNLQNGSEAIYNMVSSDFINTQEESKIDDNDITLTPNNQAIFETNNNVSTSEDGATESTVIENLPNNSGGNGRPDVETTDNNDADQSNNNDTTAYFFVAPPPHLIQQIRFGSGNPFERYLLNFPQMNMFHLENSGNVQNK